MTQPISKNPKLEAGKSKTQNRMFIQKKVSQINVAKKVFSKKTNKWAIRGIDKKTKEDGILVCAGFGNECHATVGYWLNLSEDEEET